MDRVITDKTMRSMILLLRGSILKFIFKSSLQRIYSEPPVVGMSYECHTTRYEANFIIFFKHSRYDKFARIETVSGICEASLATTQQFKCIAGESFSFDVWKALRSSRVRKYTGIKSWNNMTYNICQCHSKIHHGMWRHSLKGRVLWVFLMKWHVLAYHQMKVNYGLSRTPNEI